MMIVSSNSLTISNIYDGKNGAQGPQGERGKQIFKSSYEGTPNQAGRYWSDLSPAPSVDNPPKIGDTVITPAGNIFQINAVNVGGGGGGGTFGVGNVLGNIQGPQGAQGLQGLQGPQGDQGIKGPAGADGKSSYTHIAYGTSNSGAGFTQTPSASTTYIGMYVDQSVNDSNDPTKYAWSLIKGADGANGAPGKAGTDGKTPYFHQAWADSSDGTTNFSTTVSLGKKYLGTYTDYVVADSKDPTIYKWTELVGAIQVGGRNYFLDSKTSTITPPGTANWDYRIIITDGFWSNSDRLKSNNIRVSFTLTAQKALTSDFNSNLCFDASPWPAQPISYPAGTTTSKKYELVFNITDSAFKTDNCFIRFQAKDTSDFPFILEHAKLEVGTLFTDWSPAPEDLATQSQIIKLNNDINLNVKKGDLLSQINLQAGYTLVSASKQLTLSSDTIYFDTTNPVIIPSANITGTLEGKTLKAADIEANTFSTPNGSFTTDSNGAITANNMTINGGTLTSPTINAGKITGADVYAGGTYTYVASGSGNTVTGAIYNELNSNGYHQWTDANDHVRINNSTIGITNDAHEKANVDSVDGIPLGVLISDGQSQFTGNVSITNNLQVGNFYTNGYHTINSMDGGAVFLENGVSSGNDMVDFHAGVVFTKGLHTNNLGMNNGHTISSFDGGGIYVKDSYNGGGNYVNLHVKKLYQSSLLSLKTDIKPIDPNTALETINNTDFMSYHFKNDKSNEPISVSPILDDINPIPKYNTPDIFKSADGDSRNDGNILGYTALAVKALYAKIKDLTDKVNKLEGTN